MAWVTGAQATAITGVTLTDSQVAVATPFIELYADTTSAADANQSVRVLRILKYATAYQAAWMLTQIDLLARTDVQSITQDGVTINYLDADSAQLAPLARRWLDRLPWRRTRSVRIGNRQILSPNALDEIRLGSSGVSDDFEDDATPWRPLAL